MPTQSGGGRGRGLTLQRGRWDARLPLSTGQPWICAAFLLPLRHPHEFAGKQLEIPLERQLAAGPSSREEGSLVHSYHPQISLFSMKMRVMGKSPQEPNLLCPSLAHSRLFFVKATV